MSGARCWLLRTWLPPSPLNVLGTRQGVDVALSSPELTAHDLSQSCDRHRLPQRTPRDEKRTRERAALSLCIRRTVHCELQKARPHYHWHKSGVRAADRSSRPVRRMPNLIASWVRCVSGPGRPEGVRSRQSAPEGCITSLRRVSLKPKFYPAGLAALAARPPGPPGPSGPPGPRPPRPAPRPGNQATGPLACARPQNSRAARCRWLGAERQERPRRGCHLITPQGTAACGPCGHMRTCTPPGDQHDCRLDGGSDQSCVPHRLKARVRDMFQATVRRGRRTLKRVKLRPLKAGRRRRRRSVRRRRLASQRAALSGPRALCEAFLS